MPVNLFLKVVVICDSFVNFIAHLAELFQGEDT